jgi:energy-coupling factor transport system ATP-binding protein
VGGHDIAGRSVADVCRQVGYLPQDPNALLFADTVLDELMTTLRNHGLEDRDNHSTYPEELLLRLGLAHYARAYPRDLSAGERQRVALGAITVTRPAGLLLDEPTRGLDYAAKNDLLRLLKGWRDDGVAVVLVTHDVELAAEAADRVVVMDRGKTVAVGAPVDILGGSPIFATQTARLFPGADWLTPGAALGARP